MCWESKKKCVRLLADKDIHVFKICKKCRSNSNVVLPYFYSEKAVYQDGKTYESDRPIEILKEHKVLSLSLIKVNSILNGIHSYSCDCVILHYGDVFAITDKYGSTLETYKSNVAVVVECSIPKGTAYYVNEHGEYVSDKIKIENITDIKFFTDINGIIRNWKITN